MPLGEEDCQATYKILIIGDASVGKTALLRALTSKAFTEKTRPTVAVDFVRKSFEVDGALVQLQIWDTAGHERFHSITRWHYRGTKGIVVVYDVTDRETFKHLSYWIDSVSKGVSHSTNKYESVPLVIVGNKTDLNDNRAVKSKEGRKLAEKHMAFGFFETSAKTGENVLKAFHEMAYHVTDICDPKLMKSYHPKMLRPPEIVRSTGSTMRQMTQSDLEAFNSKTKKKKQKKKKKKKEKSKPEVFEMTTLSIGYNVKSGEIKQNGDYKAKTKKASTRGDTVKLKPNSKKRQQCCVVS